MEMKRYLLALLITIAAIAPLFLFKDRFLPFTQPFTYYSANLTCNLSLGARQDNCLKYLKVRKDGLAWIEAEKILSIEPNNLCGLWAKAEILRRLRKFKESEDLLNKVLVQCPDYVPCLISLSYIRYHDNKFDEALEILKEALRQPDLDRENKALTYMLMGSINARKSSLGGIFAKIAYGMRVKGLFEKANAIAPDLSEVHLGLGSFYLLAPRIAGGDINKAIEELECAVRLTPDFATANARLAQAYKKQGDLEKYNFYLKRAKELDPQNEVLEELKENK
jgi:tetratricopeptide (TPR) repeat protein